MGVAEIVKTLLWLLLVGAVVIPVACNQLPELLYFRMLPARVLTPTVAPGGTLRYILTPCNNSGEEMLYTVHRELVRPDATTYSLGLANEYAAKGCSFGEINALIPDDVTPGPYTLRAVGDVHAWWRSTTFFYRTAAFVVMAP